MCIALRDWNAICSRQQREEVDQVGFGKVDPPPYIGVIFLAKETAEAEAVALGWQCINVHE